VTVVHGVFRFLKWFYWERWYLCLLSDVEILSLEAPFSYHILRIFRLQVFSRCIRFVLGWLSWSVDPISFELILCLEISLGFWGLHGLPSLLPNLDDLILTLISPLNIALISAWPITLLIVVFVSLVFFLLFLGCRALRSVFFFHLRVLLFFGDRSFFVLESRLSISVFPVLNHYRFLVSLRGL